MAAVTVIAALTPQSVGSASAEPRGRISALDLLTLRDIAALSVSPDGANAVFQISQADPERNRYEIAWYVADLRHEGQARRVADAGEPMLTTYQGRVNGHILPVAPVWSEDARWIVYLRRDRGLTQVWRVRRDGGRNEQLTRNESDVRAVVFSRDGRSLLFETEPSRGQLEDALSVEALTGFLYDRRFFPAYGVAPTMPSDALLGGSILLPATNHEVAMRRIWAYELRSGRERFATESERAEFDVLIAPPAPTNRPAFRGSATASGDGRLVWTEALDPARQGAMPPVTIVAQAPGSEAVVVCPAEECTGQFIRGLWWRDEQTVVFARGEGPSFQDTAVYEWHIGVGSTREILRTPNQLTSFADLEWRCAVSRARLICFYEKPDSPRELASVDLDTGAIRTVFNPNPTFADFDIGQSPQRLEIRTRTGIETYGYLVLPPYHRSGVRLPLVIVTYRCTGFLRGGTGDEYPIYALAAEGFAVLCFNIPTDDFERRATEGWGTYEPWARGEGDPMKRRIQDALNAAIEQLDAAAGVIDPNRVGLTGLSYGAETVSFALFNMPHLAAAIASGAEIGPSSTFLYGPAGLDSLRRWGLDSPTSARWRTLSVALNANQVSAPLLLNVADHELVTRLEVFAALTEAGKPVEMYVYPDEYHIKWQPAHRLAIYRRNIDWMNFWLRGVEDSASEKTVQYQRWRAMRSAAH